MNKRELLGQRLDTALAILYDKGFKPSEVKTIEVRSKKGIEGGVPIVIRQRLIGEKTIELCFSYFITDISEDMENEG